MALRELLPAFGAGLISEPERLAMQIEMDATEGQPQRDFLEANINDWLKSPKYLGMKLGQRYFENRGDIVHRVRKVIGRNGEMVDAPYLANNKLPHAFMRKLTKQKVGYLLSKSFTVTSDDETFQKLLGDYLTKNFYRLFKNGGQDAVVQGIGWLQVYYNEEGNLWFKRIPATEVIPFWADIDHTKLDAAIRVYETEVFEGTEKSIVTHIKYFTLEKVYNYVQDETGIHPDPDAPIEFNFSVTRPSVAEDGSPLEEGVTENYMWDRIPLIPLKYNTEEDSLLQYIKDLIDDYDRRTSDMSNVIQDEPDRIKVVKDYDGTDKGEFVYNLAKYRTLFLRGTGSVETLDTSISTEAIEQHLTRLRSDIYEFGGGVDTQNKDLGNASGVALKFVYSDLDMDCADFGNELAWAVEQICWFIKQDLLLKGKGDFTDASVNVTFNTDITINETETIDNISKSVGIVSNKTLLEQHPYVDDVDEELKNLDQEAQEELQRTEEELQRTSAINRASTPTPQQASAPSSPPTSGTSAE